MVVVYTDLFLANCEWRLQDSYVNREMLKTVQELLSKGYITDYRKSLETMHRCMTIREIIMM